MDETHSTSIELNSLLAESENISTNANRRPVVKSIGNNKFYIEDLDKEMRMVKMMRQNKPEYMKVFMDQGNELVSYAQIGDLPSIVSIVDSVPKEEILSYHIVKMAVVASVNFHFNVLKYMFLNGLNISFVAFRDLPITMIEYHKGEKQDELFNLISLYITMGMDVNTCHPETYETTLFPAIRYQYPKIVELLVNKGTDINAVVKDDLMPLILAKQINETHHTDVSQHIVDFLISKGAKMTWRSDGGEGEKSETTTSSKPKYVTYKSAGGGMMCSTIVGSIDTIDEAEDEEEEEEETE